MKKRWIMIVSGLGLLGLALVPTAGCKEVSCESVCESRNDCEGSMKTPDCAASCDLEVQSARDTGCKGQYDSLLACEGAVDVCSSDTFCTAQSASYAKCVSDACTKDPSTCSGS